jgi:hypothetical protein
MRLLGVQRSIRIAQLLHDSTASLMHRCQPTRSGGARERERVTERVRESPCSHLLSPHNAAMLFVAGVGVDSVTVSWFTRRGGVSLAKRCLYVCYAARRRTYADVC